MNFGTSQIAEVQHCYVAVECVVYYRKITTRSLLQACVRTHETRSQYRMGMVGL